MTMRAGQKRRNGKFGDPKWMRKIGRKRKYQHSVKGEDNGHAKLRATDVLFIRRYKFMPRGKAKQIARRFGIALSYVYAIRRRVTWKHL